MALDFEADTWVVEAWHHPDGEIAVAQADSMWLSALGPSSMCLLRVTAAMLYETHPRPAQISPHLLAKSIGLVRATGKEYGAFARTLDRLQRFNFLKVIDETTIATRVMLPVRRGQGGQVVAQGR